MCDGQEEYQRKPELGFVKKGSTFGKEKKEMTSSEQKESQAGRVEEQSRVWIMHEKEIKQRGLAVKNTDSRGIKMKRRPYKDAWQSGRIWMQRFPGVGKKRELISIK